MGKLDEFLQANPSINESQLLSEDALNLMEGGNACDGVSCKKACEPGCKKQNKGGGSGGGSSSGGSSSGGSGGNSGGPSGGTSGGSKGSGGSIIGCVYRKG